MRRCPYRTVLRRRQAWGERLETGYREGVEGRGLAFTRAIRRVRARDAVWRNEVDTDGVGGLPHQRRKQGIERGALAEVSLRLGISGALCGYQDVGNPARRGVAKVAFGSGGQPR